MTLTHTGKVIDMPIGRYSLIAHRTINEAWAPLGSDFKSGDRVTIREYDFEKREATGNFCVRWVTWLNPTGGTLNIGLTEIPPR